jgi:hypothetical protein
MTNCKNENNFVFYRMFVDGLLLFFEIILKALDTSSRYSLCILVKSMLLGRAKPWTVVSLFYR